MQVQPADRRCPGFTLRWHHGFAAVEPTIDQRGRPQLLDHRHSPGQGHSGYRAHKLGSNAKMRDLPDDQTAGKCRQRGRHRSQLQPARRFGRRKEIHPGRADRPGDKDVVRAVIQNHKWADLLDPPGTQHHDPVGKCHGLGLIMGDVDDRIPQSLVQLSFRRGSAPAIRRQGSTAVRQTATYPDRRQSPGQWRRADADRRTARPACAAAAVPVARSWRLWRPWRRSRLWDGGRSQAPMDWHCAT